MLEWSKKNRFGGFLLRTFFTQADAKDLARVEKSHQALQTLAKTAGQQLYALALQGNRGLSEDFAERLIPTNNGN